MPSRKGQQSGVLERTINQSAVSTDTRSLGEGIDEKVIGVTSDVPHGETKQLVIDDELPLGGKRCRIVVGNHQLLSLVVRVRLGKRRCEELRKSLVRA